MDLKEIKTVIELMKRNDLALFEMEREGFKIKLQRGVTGGYSVTHYGESGAPPITPLALPAAGAAPGATPPVAASEPAEALREIVSPMVGTFYQSPSPEAGPFVQVGHEVNEETVVCIIEAMKVMNEIKAEARGVIAEITAENGKPVQFGQALFKLR